MTRVLVGFLPEEYPGVESFEALGECTYLRYDEKYLEEHLPEYDIFVPHLFLPVTREVIQKSAPKLKVVATPSTGSDHIDLKALQECGVHFVSLNDDRDFIDEISSTAEMAWLLILSCARKMLKLVSRVQEEKSWVNTDIRGYELFGKTLGIVGYGRLGKKVARFAEAFGMTILAYDKDPQVFSGDTLVKSVSYEDLLQQSDVVSLHMKLNETSANMLDAKAVSLMKDGAILVNTARGGIIDSEAVLKGLDNGKIGAVGLDVCNNEYQSAELPDDALLKASFNDQRIIVTPHAGGSTYDAHEKVFGKIASLVSQYLQNEKVAL